MILRLRARSAGNNWIPKRDGYIHTNYFQDATQNWLPRAKALDNEEDGAIDVWNVHACGFRIASKTRSGREQDAAYG